MKFIFRVFSLLFVASTSAVAGERVRVVASVFPVETMVRALGGDRVEVETFLDHGEDCHSFNPGPRKLQRLSSAGLFVAVGVGYERGLLPKMSHSFPAVSVLALNEQAEELIASSDHDHDGHVHGPHCAAGHADPHTWLNPRRVMEHAERLSARLAALDPEDAAGYARRLEEFRGQVAGLDAGLRAALAPHEGEAFMVYHPAFGHFAEAYGLRQIAVEEEGKVPSARRLSAIIDAARAEGVRAILIQPQEPAGAVERIAAALGLQPIPADPMAPDFLAVLTRLADDLNEALTTER